MGTNFTNLATTDPLIADVLNDVLDEVDGAITDRANVNLNLTAGEAIAIRQVVYISTGTGGGTAGRAYLADADAAGASTAAWVVGVAPAAIASGAAGVVRLVGVVGGFTDLTPGAVQYVSATAGALTETPPANAYIVGIALSATEVLVLPRGHQNLRVPGQAGHATGMVTPPTYYAS